MLYTFHSSKGLMGDNWLQFNPVLTRFVKTKSIILQGKPEFTRKNGPN